MVLYRTTSGNLPAQNAHADRRLQEERVGTTVRSHRFATANESIRFCTVGQVILVHWDGTGGRGEGQ